MKKNQMNNDDLLQLVNNWNDTCKKYPLDICLHALFKEQVLKSPDAPALWFRDEIMTYRDLDQKSDCIAGILQKQGVGPDVIVGICLERSFEMVIGLLAILKAGGAYLPLDPQLPQERMRFVIGDAQLKHIVTTKQCQHLVDFSQTFIVNLDDSNLYHSTEKCSIVSDVKPENLAYVIYTSGSTGQPKGAMIEHKAIVNRILWMQDQFNITKNDRVLQKTSYSFDVSVWEFFWPLTMGSQLVLANPGGQKDTDYLHDAIANYSITIIHFVPSMLRLFLNSAQMQKTKSLRLVICSGEALPVDLEKAFFGKINASLFNLYGPTEAAVDVSCWECLKESSLSTVPIGRPIANIQLYILDEQLQLTEIGQDGELYIGGIGLARGYLNRPELTNEKFIVNPLKGLKGDRLYKTGDICRYMPDGNIHYVGRADFQVKIRGFRVELGEIECVIRNQSAVKDCVVVAREDIPGDTRLVAYVILNNKEFDSNILKNVISDTLPEYMVPSSIVTMDSFPLNTNDKLDRKKLPKPGRSRPDLKEPYYVPKTEREKQIEVIWCNVLDLETVGIRDNFFDLGGNSFLVFKVVNDLRDLYGISVPLVKIFELPTIEKLAAYCDETINEKKDISNLMIASPTLPENENMQNSIAIIGMSGKFPGAGDIETFWKNICDGKESLCQFTEQDLLDAGIETRHSSREEYISMAPVIEDSSLFDAAFFGYCPEDARMIDPQQRLFLECCWSALENAGYNPENYSGKIGVFGGCGMNHYLIKNVIPKINQLNPQETFEAMVGNEKDFITTRVSYCLNLTGPSINVQTGCSTSLVAVHIACQQLLNYECDMALAGGVSLKIPQKQGYLYQEGMILSRDGHCRTFDSNASGTIPGEGVGIVLLKRYSDALKDNDEIDAVIIGSAINNDGSLKVGYTAPSIQGQVEVIKSALSMAEIDPQTIGYIEAHGTGTPLGDPIEVRALTEVFGETENKYCALGSVKANIGHLDIASGIAGLIKTVLVLKKEKIPPVINVVSPKPELQLDKTPFFLNNTCIDLKVKPSAVGIGELPMRAGVSSFGIGGTNAHVVLEKARIATSSAIIDKPAFILPLSAKNSMTLETIAVNLAKFLENNLLLTLSDVAYTLQYGRKQFPVREAIIATTIEDAIFQFRQKRSDTNSRQSRTNPKICFMFTGQGSQYAGMAQELYSCNKLFKREFDACVNLIRKYSGFDISEVVFPDIGSVQPMNRLLEDTTYTQPALFSVEYSLARLLMHLGVVPDCMIGHSVGEFVAATIAGVFTLEEAIEAVCVRARLMAQMPEGTMLSVAASAEQMETYCNENVSVAVVNAPGYCVIAGPTDMVLAVKEKLELLAIKTSVLKTSHAFHSPMMATAAGKFVQILQKMKLSTPSISFVSGVSGTWITAEEATSAEYWGRQIINTVQFCKGVSSVLGSGANILLEAGPGSTLCTLVTGQLSGNAETNVIQLLPAQDKAHSTYHCFLASVAELYRNNVTIEWNILTDGKAGKRIHLPTYPFERKRHWIDAPGVREKDILAGPQLQAAENGTIKSQSETMSVSDIVHSIWSNVLGVSEINSKDDFYNLGGNSLILAKVFARLRTITGNKLTLQDLAKTSTLQEQIMLVSENVSTLHTAKPTIPVVDRTGFLPLSESQERLWFINKMDPHNISHNLVQAIELTGKIKEDFLVKSWGHIFERHEVLHCRFHETESGPVVKIDRSGNNALTIIDCCEYASSVRYAENMILEQARIPVDLSTGPLCKAVLYKVAGEKAYFVVFAHHIICDGWSMSIWVEELMHLYTSYLTGADPTLPELPFQFIDYVVWQRSKTPSYLTSDYKKFWTDIFSSTPPVIQLPTDFKRPALPDYNGKLKYFTLSEENTAKVIAVSRREKVTVFHVLLSMLFTLLYRYSNQSEIVIGCPHANRSENESLEKLIGFFINMIPYKIDFTQVVSFRDLLVLVKNYSEKCTAYQEVPFAKLVEIINPPRAINHTPVFQVMFAYQNYPYSVEPLEGVRVKRRFFEHGASEYDLALYLAEEDQKIGGVFEYSTALFTENTITTMSHVFNRIIEEVTSDVNQPIQTVALLTDEMVRKFGLERESAKVDYDGDQNVVRCFNEAKFSFPEKNAITCGDISISYEELNRKTNKLASYLRKKGVSPGAFVGIVADRSIEMVIAMLGVLKSGGAYIPLDPLFPQERLLFMVMDSGLKVLIRKTDVTVNFEAIPGITMVDLDLCKKEIGQESDADLSIITKDVDPAYLIYTSGSTGKPKGVAISHRSLINFLLSMKKKPGLKECDILLAVTTISFDISVLEIFGTLSVGATLILADSIAAVNGERLLMLIKKLGVTIMQATPVTWKNLLDAGWHNTPKLKVLCGGEQLSRGLANKLLATQAEVWNMFGPTETTVWSSVGKVLYGEEDPDIGTPIDNTWFLIIDSKNNLVPDGMFGELAIGGDGLAIGYLNNPDLTAERFIEHPIGGRLYKTGDLARKKYNGTFEYHGRLDFQVKINGFRIELGDIENAIREFSGVKDVVVNVNNGSGESKYIVAFIITTSGNIKSDEIRAHCQKKLPYYMVPKVFELISQFPLTTNGKVDRKNLPVPHAENIIVEKSFNPPVGAMEKELALLWEQFLNKSNISIDTNYFDLGGTSILAIRLFAQIEKQFGVSLPIATLFTAPTIRLLSKVLVEKKVPAKWSIVVPIKPTGTKKPLFLVHGGGGNVLLYRDLANSLEKDQPVFGIQSQGLNGVDPVIFTIEEMAQRYIQEIVAIDPEGPYYLGGYCMGGTIAYEMACQLEMAGKDVAMVALFDTYREWYEMSMYQRVAYFFDNVQFHLKNIQQASIRGKVDFVRDRTAEAIRRIQRSGWVQLSRLLYIAGIRKIKPLVPMEKINDGAAMKYLAKPYRGKITVFKPKSISKVIDPYLGWKSVSIGSVELVDLSAYRNGMLVVPYVTETASRLTEVIAKTVR